jgi:hypothetical protein
MAIVLDGIARAWEPTACRVNLEESSLPGKSWQKDSER